MGPDTITILIIVLVIIFEAGFFSMNLRRMRQFSNIFSEPKSWMLRRDEEFDMVNGVAGKGGPIFENIVTSINKYLGKAGTEIDFGLIKDAIDRHCDSVENDISSQNPLPLYCGLAGTMGCVIVGLIALLGSGAIDTLMQSGTSVGVSEGVTGLLKGVAWAMSASIVGLLLTITNLLNFKRCKLAEDAGKNDFFAWLQSELLPEFATDPSQALNSLVKNLRNFNKTFAENTSNFKSVLTTVDQSASVIKTIYDGVTKEAEINHQTLKELKECTDRLGLFNQYLNDVRGYTEAIHRFEEQFQSESERIHILEEIRDFFRNNKGAIAKTMTEADDAIQTALAAINDNTEKNIRELNVQFTKLVESFQDVLKEEKEVLEKSAKELGDAFSEQLRQHLPRFDAQMEAVSAIPAQMAELLTGIGESNKQLVEEISTQVAPRFDAQMEALSAITGQIGELLTGIEKANERLIEEISAQVTRPEVVVKGQKMPLRFRIIIELAAFLVIAFIIFLIVTTVLDQLGRS